MPKKKNKLPLTKLLDSEYLEKLLNQSLVKVYPQFQKIKDLSIQPIKEHFGENFEHLVAVYSFFVINQDNKYRRVNIYCSAHSDGSRKNILKLLKFVNEANISSQKPLFYDQDTQAMFYEGIRGQNLYYYIQHQADIEDYLKETAKKLAQLHKLKINSSTKVSQFRSNLWSLDPSNVLGDKKIELVQAREEIIKLLKHTQKKFKKLKIDQHQKYFIHGDFHPENVIIAEDDKQVNIIDFTDVKISDFAQDLGSFLQQLRFMSLRFYPSRKIDYYQNLFLKKYFWARKIRYSRNIKNRVLFFQAWLSLRSAVFFLRSQNGETKVNFLIQQSKEFLDQIK